MVLYFLLFLLPLVIFPFGVSPFESPKVIAAFFGIEIFILLALIQKPKFSILNKKQLFFTLILFFISVIDLILSKNGFWGNMFRQQGVFLLWHLLAFSVVLALTKESPKKNIFLIIPYFLFILSAFIFGRNEAGRAVGTMGEPNALASVVVFLWPLVGLNIFSFISALATIFITGSRSGLSALFIQVIFILLIKFNFPKKYSLFIIFFIMTLTLTLPFFDKNRLFENRSEIWKTSFIAGLSKPILGSGFGNIEMALKNTSINLPGVNNIKYQPIDSSHNILLDYFIEGGLVGLASFILIIFFALKGLETKETIILFGLLETLLFNPASIVSLVALWWLIGMGFYKNNNIKETVTPKIPIAFRTVNSSLKK